ncbi:MAG: tetratricopeptide repeat protein [Bacteroidota bacterium]
MKSLITTLLLTITLAAFGQTAQEHLENGIDKHNKQDFKGALKDYNKAIKADDKLPEAYFNRGTVKLATNDLKGALTDFDKAISLDESFIKAYYSRATVFVSQKKYGEAMPDLNKVIEMDKSFPNALTLRGQLHFALKDKKACCKDFQLAKEIGDPAADKYMEKYCGNTQQGGESLMLYWPEEENWKMESSQENEQVMMIELVRNDETLDNWTEIGTMQSIKGVTGVPMDKAMNLMYEQSKKKCPKAQLTFIEKDETVEFPWVIFTIECASYKDSKTAESQLWYIVQGKTSLYTNFRAIKEAKLPEATKEKWIEFFKGGKVVYMDAKK